MKIAVLCGGRSAEREVSLKSRGQVQSALRELGHEVAQVDIDANTWDVLRDGSFGCVFNALHGRLGEDGTVQGMLELLGLPYTGSGVLASALCMDKARAGAVMMAAGLDVPEFDELEVKEGVSADTVEQLIAKYGLPLVIKPVREGSTIGLTIARDADGVASGLVLASKYDRRVLAQRFQEGTEITVGVLATPDIQVLPTLEIVSENPVYDYDAKYTAGKSHHIIPARITERAREEAQHDAGVAFQVLGCSGMARVDIIVDADGTPWILEVNTVPGLTSLSLLPDAAKAAGISFTELWTRSEKSLQEPDVHWFRRAAAGGVAVVEAALLLFLLLGPATAIRNVEVHGANHMTVAQVMKAAGLDQPGSILAVDPAAEQQRLLGQTWIRTASVQPMLNGTVRIDISEWQPVAVYHAGASGALFLMSDQAVLLGPASAAGLHVNIQGPGGRDSKVGDRPLDPQLLVALVNIQRGLPGLIGQQVSMFIVDSCGALTMVTTRGWKAYFGRVLTPEEFSSLRDKLAALKAIAGSVNYNSTDLDYINVMNASEPAAAFKSKEPTTPSPSPVLLPTPAPTPTTTCK